MPVCEHHPLMPVRRGHGSRRPTLPVTGHKATDRALEILGRGVYRQARRTAGAVLPVTALFVIWDAIAIAAPARVAVNMAPSQQTQTVHVHIKMTNRLFIKHG